VKVVLPVLFLFAIFIPISLYIIHQFIGNKVIKPTLYFGDKQNQKLRELSIDSDSCDPLPCSNTYLVLTSSRVLEADFEYCNYSAISGNVFVSDKNRYSLPNFGSDKYCGSDSRSAYLCKEGNSLTEYKIYKMFPYPKKIDLNFYSCSRSE